MEPVGTRTHPFMAGRSYKLLGKSFVPNFVLIVAVVSFTPMLLVAGLILDQFNISHKEKLYAHLTEVVHKHTQDIDNFLNERVNNIRFLSETCGKDNLFDEPFLQEKLLQLQQAYGGVFEDLGIVNEKGVQEYFAGRFKLKNADYSDAEWFKKAIKMRDIVETTIKGNL